MTGASLGFGKTLLSASYNFFLMSVLTSMYDPRTTTLAAVEKERKTLCNEEELHDLRDDTQKKEEHFQPVMCPAQFNLVVTPVSSVYICFNSFSRPLYTQLFLLVMIVPQSFRARRRFPILYALWLRPSL